MKVALLGTRDIPANYGGQSLTLLDRRRYTF